MKIPLFITYNNIAIKFSIYVILLEGIKTKFKIIFEKMDIYIFFFLPPLNYSLQKNYQIYSLFFFKAPAPAFYVLNHIT